MIRKVKPYVQAIKDQYSYPWSLLFLIVTHESGWWVFKQLHGEIFATEREAVSAMNKAAK